MRMQEDAIKRVRDMQERSTMATQDANNNLVSHQNAHASQHDSSNQQQTQGAQNNTFFNQQNRANNNQTFQNETQQNRSQNIYRSPRISNNPNRSGVRNARARAISKPPPEHEQFSQENTEQSRQHNDNINHQNASHQNANHQNANHNNAHANHPPQNPLFNLLGGGKGISQLFNNSGLTHLFGNGLGGFLGKGGYGLSSIIEKINDPESGDQLLLLALLILLSNEDSDKLLLLAILYIFLG